MNDEADFSTGTALYYPCIHPRDIHAVKAALLFWDRVRRIVPDAAVNEGHVQDDEDEARVLTECDLLVSTRRITICSLSRRSSVSRVRWCASGDGRRRLS